MIYSICGASKKKVKGIIISHSFIFILCAIILGNLFFLVLLQFLRNYNLVYVDGYDCYLMVSVWITIALGLFAVKMANKIMKTLLEQGTHEVGVLNGSQSRDIVNGAKLKGGDLDNFLLVEDAGWDEDGRLCKALSANTKKGFLVTTIEEESLYADEEILQGTNYGI